MTDVLMEITKEHLETGMRGFPVGYCTTSHVDPLKGYFMLVKLSMNWPCGNLKG